MDKLYSDLGFIFAPISLVLLIISIRSVNKDEMSNKTSIGFIFIATLYLFLAIFSQKDGYESSLSLLFITYPILYSIIFIKQIRKLFGSDNISNIRKYFSIVFILMLGETFVVLDYGGDIIIHFLTFLGFYLGVAIVMMYFLSKYEFSLLRIFVIGGIWGVIYEQNFFLIVILFSLDIFSFVLIGSMVFISYGFYTFGIYRVFFQYDKTEASGKDSLMLLFSIIIFPLITWLIVNSILGYFGVEFVVFE